VNFLNFEDPAVLARLTGPDYEQLWKKTYGYDYVIKKGLARKKQKGQYRINNTKTPKVMFFFFNEKRFSDSFCVLTKLCTFSIRICVNSVRL
jgi:hypothetical protein